MAPIDAGPRLRFRWTTRSADARRAVASSRPVPRAEHTGGTRENTGGERGVNHGGTKRRTSDSASQRPTGGDKAIAGKKQYFRRKKVCRFCVEKIDDINYKDVQAAELVHLRAW